MRGRSHGRSEAQVNLAVTHVNPKLHRDLQRARNEARAKDRVEDALHEAVCNGEMPLVDAQQRIVRDWKHALDYQGYGVLKASGDYLGVGHDQPGLDVRGIDHIALAQGLGASAYHVEALADLMPALRDAFESQGPTLVSIAVDPTIAPLLS